MPNDDIYANYPAWIYRSFDQPSPNFQAELAELRLELAALTEVCKQMQAILFEMHFGQQSDTIIIPPQDWTPPREGKG